MEKWILNNECTGCGACDNICPKNAISMSKDIFGFNQVIIDNSLCVNCGKCKRSCPIVKKPEMNEKIEAKVYAAWSKDEKIRFDSTSGGAFTEIAKVILSNGGYVVGAKYNEENLVEHSIVNDEQGLSEIRQSKYIQSDIKYIFREIKELLDNNKEVLFCGAPCQVAGLNKFLVKKYEKLTTIEFICRGMNSPKAYKKWLEEIEYNEKKKVKKVWFKYKENGWNKSPKCTRIDFTDKSNVVLSGESNLFMSGYLGPNLYIRPSCGNCKFNGIDRVADITLADFWGINSEYDDDKGTSLVLINSNHGNQLFERVKNSLVFTERSLEEVYKGNICFKESVKINSKSEKFLKEINDISFSIAIKKYTKKSILNKYTIKVKNIIKIILRKIKVYK